MEHLRCWSAGFGAVLGDFIGSIDGMLYVLIAFVVVDYLTGVLCAVMERNAQLHWVQGHLPESDDLLSGRCGACAGCPGTRSR